MHACMYVLRYLLVQVSTYYEVPVVVSGHFKREALAAIRSLLGCHLPKWEIIANDRCSTYIHVWCTVPENNLRTCIRPTLLRDLGTQVIGTSTYPPAMGLLNCMVVDGLVSKLPT
jgi:hypothetical protein